jgi:hypothetical protein
MTPANLVSCMQCVCQLSLVLFLSSILTSKTVCRHWVMKARMRTLRSIDLIRTKMPHRTDLIRVMLFSRTHLVQASLSRRQQKGLAYLHNTKRRNCYATSFRWQVLIR